MYFLQQRVALCKWSVHLGKGFTISEFTSSQLYINCCCKSSQFPFLPIPNEPFFPLSFSIGRWVVIRMGRWSDNRVSSDSQSYLSWNAALTIVASGEEKASVDGFCPEGCSESLRNVLLSSMAAFTRYSPLALGLAVWSQAVSWTLMSAQITSCWLDLRQWDARPLQVMWVL